MESGRSEVEDVEMLVLSSMRVQNLIERCLQLYMSEREVVSTLLHQAKIEPGFTELVWQKLEAENQEFFRAYHMRLIVKDQITRFNHLLERQVELMRQVCQTGVASMSNGSQIHSKTSPVRVRTAVLRARMDPARIAARRAACLVRVLGPLRAWLARPPSCAAALARLRPSPRANLVRAAQQFSLPGSTTCWTIYKNRNVHRAINNIPNVYSNGSSSLQPCMQVGAHMAGHAGRIDVSENVILAQNSNTRMIQGLNGVMIKSEGGYAGDSPFMFGADNNLLEPRTAVGEASVSPFNGGDSSSQALNESMLDQEMNSFGFLGQIPRNFSLSDLTADFSNSTDILESYSRSPFLGAEANFLDPHIRGEQEDIKRLDTISEGLSYDDFGSD
ncbi:hypothetical protein DH2020_013968 [Rehmannia glutinosa]|uniref:Uncharacterized protein n=1 Tax=Rehmannia glutinosa TaxID=99300 RepID=A0ABR0WV08_REHGL